MPIEPPFQDDPIETKQFDPEPACESIHGRVTLVSASTFFPVVAFSLTASWLAPQQSWPQIKEAIQVTLPAVTAILGTALGFYFSSQKR